MWPLATNVLSNAYTFAAIVALNYMLLIGIRDILYFILPIGPTARQRRRAKSAHGFFGFNTLKRIIFWTAFVYVALLMRNFVAPVSVFVILAYFLFKAAEKKRIAPNYLVAVCAALLAATAFVFIRSQPVFMKIDRQFSVDLWIYNACNSFIDAMLAAGLRLHVNTTGIARLEALVPWVQENVTALLFLSLYLFSGIFITHLARAILPGTKYESPLYYRIAPVREFGVAAALLLIAAHFLHAPQLTFAVAGIYYLWGVNMLIYSLRGGQWAANMFIAAAGALNPWTIAFFIALGALDNLFDIRRLATVLGFGEREKNRV